MTWNHRVVKRTYPNGDVSFGIHEVYYDDNGNVTGCTEDPIGVVEDTEEDLYTTLNRLIDAAGKDVLIYEELSE